MPFRNKAALALSELHAVLAHPARLRIIEELGGQELDVAGLARLMGLGQAATSQHLARLRAQQLVVERREGRHVFYRVKDPNVTRWLAVGFDLVLARLDQDRNVASSIQRARKAWSGAQ